MNLYIQIRAVSVTAFDVHTVRRIQHINDLLLHIAVKHIIKRIDMHRFRKDFFVFFSDGRNRVSNNRKTAFLPVNVMIDQLALLAALIHIDFPLFVGIGNALLFLLRRKRLCPENFDHCRSSVIWSNRFVIFPDSTVNFESPLDECLIQPQPAVLFVIVSKLLVQGNRVRTQHRLQSDLFKIVYGGAYHPLESQRITDLHYRLFRNIFSGCFKSDPVSFGKCIRHCLHLLLCQGMQKMCGLRLIFSNIQTITVQICRMIQLRFHHDLGEIIIFRIDQSADRIRIKNFCVIMHKRIHAFSDLVHIQILCILKTVVNFHKQFRINTQITDISFHTAGINSMQSGIQCREQRSVFPAHLTDGICRVCITVRIIFLHIQIQTAIDLFPFQRGNFCQFSTQGRFC